MKLKSSIRNKTVLTWRKQQTFSSVTHTGTQVNVRVHDGTQARCSLLVCGSFEGSTTNTSEQTIWLKLTKPELQLNSRWAPATEANLLFPHLFTPVLLFDICQKCDRAFPPISPLDRHAFDRIILIKVQFPLQSLQDFYSVSQIKTCVLSHVVQQDNIYIVFWQCSLLLLKLCIKLPS